MKLSEIVNEIDKICPFSLQEEWDHSGVQIGDGEAEIHKILMAFDFTEEILAEAIAGEYDLVIIHHPFFFQPLYSVDLQTSKGRMVAGLIKHDIALIACHTNLDKIGGFGVNAVLGNTLGLTGCRTFMAEESGVGFGMIGTLPEAMPFAEFAQAAKERLRLDSVRTVGNEKDAVRTVAVMGGSGFDFMADAINQGADVYLSSDFKYHDGQRAAETGLKLIDCSHFGTEVPVVRVFAEKLKNILTDVEIDIATGIKDYWKYR